VSPPTGRRSVQTSPQRFFLVLDGVPCGLLASATGGNATADVVGEDGHAGFVPKHLGPVRYEPITISLGLSLSPVVYEWIAAWWSGSHVRKSGVIQSLGLDHKVVGQLEFEDASIVRTDLPALDGASKAQCTLSLTLAPRRTARSKPAGQAKVVVSKAQRAWRASNFRLEIDDLDCSRVSTVSSLAVPGKAPIDFPSIELALSPVGAASWLEWHESFVVQGQNDDSHERGGELVYLSPDGKGELGRVNLHSLGIYRIAPELQESDGAPTSAANRLVASLYCERMGLEVATAP
jgi:T4-like virus tail tube protein gp19